MAELGVGDLVARFALADPAAERLGIVAQALAHDPHAPVAGTPPRRRVCAEHLADSLVGLELDVVRGATEIVDIGSGAGLPALPLAIARPSAQVVALESNLRKARFVSGLIDRCGLGNVRAVAARAEAWGDRLECFDLAVARALAPLGVVEELAAPLLRGDGVLVAWRGRRDPADEHAAVVAGDELGLELVEVRRVIPFRGAEHRHLHVMRKARATPDRFPRRVGVARKRPLGSVV